MEACVKQHKHFCGYCLYHSVQIRKGHHGNQDIALINLSVRSKHIILAKFSRCFVSSHGTMSS